LRYQGFIDSGLWCHYRLELADTLPLYRLSVFSGRESLVQQRFDVRLVREPFFFRLFPGKSQIFPRNSQCDHLRRYLLRSRDPFQQLFFCQHLSFSALQRGTKLFVMDLAVLIPPIGLNGAGQIANLPHINHTSNRRSPSRRL
jgi:hypothetical protein